MARWGWRDWILAGAFGPFWALCFALSLWDGLSHPQGNPTIFASVDGPGAYPVVVAVRPEEPNLQPGDRLVSMGGEDLKGVTYFEFRARFNDLRLSEADSQLAYERDGERRTASLPVTVPTFRWWAGLLCSLAFAITSFLVLLRARSWHLRRRFFAGAMPWAILTASSFTEAGGAFSTVGGFTRLGAVTLGTTIAVRNAFEWTESGRRAARPWQLGTAYLIGGLYVLAYIQHGWSPFPIRIRPVTNLVMLAYCIVTLYAFTWVSRQSDAGERRRIRWVVYGFAISMVALAASSIAQVLSPMSEVRLLVGTLSALAGIAVPAGLLISILFYDYLDVDRLITGTAAAGVLLAALGATAFAAVPPLSDAIGASLSSDPRNVQLVISMALAALLVPGYQTLSRRFDAWLFPQREALEHGFDQLLEALSRCRGAGELTRIAGESIDRLLQPESIVTYAREEDVFTPVFVRGRAVPPAFDANSPLVTALQGRTGPLVAGNLVRSGEAELSPFDRAALETLDVATIGPTHRRGNLVAFQCLGPKRSGDIYTATDLALLSAVSSKVADLLDRFDDEAVLTEARQMQSALRRYVPGAVAEGLVRGEELPMGEQEVSVLFVDIRGYVRLAEGLDPGEIFSTVNQYTEKVSNVVQSHGGCVVEFNGDGMMAVFGAPKPLDDKEACAVAAAREVVTALERSEISVGIGIATGSAFVGDIQSADRHIWSVIGNTTNLAARLQALTRKLDAAIAVDAATRSAAGPACRGFLMHADVRIRGRSEPLDVFALPLQGRSGPPARLSAVR